MAKHSVIGSVLLTFVVSSTSLAWENHPATGSGANASQTLTAHQRRRIQQITHEYRERQAALRRQMTAELKQTLSPEQFVVLREILGVQPSPRFTPPVHRATPSRRTHASHRPPTGPSREVF